MKNLITIFMILFSINLYSQSGKTNQNTLQVQPTDRFPTLFIPNYVSSKPSRNNPSNTSSRSSGSKSVLGAVWRSTLFPGWGQHYQDSTMRGSLYNVIGIILIVNLAARANEYNEARSKYNDYFNLNIAKNPIRIFSFGGGTLLIDTIKATELRSNYDSAASAARNASVALAVFWTWNILDAIIFGNFSSGSANLEKKGNPSLLSLKTYGGLNVNLDVSSANNRAYNALSREEQYRMEFTKQF